MISTKNTRNTKNLLLGLAVLVGSQVLYADDIISSTDEILNSEQIDIEGSYSAGPSQADKLANLRKKLEKKNEDMMHKKIEDIRMKEESKLTNRLQKAFNGGMKAIDEEATYGSAPVKQVSIAPVVASAKSPEVKVIPALGMSNYQGERLNYDSNMSMSLDVDAMLGQRFSIGFGFAFENMGVQEQNNGYGGYNQQNYSNYYTQNYYNSYGTYGRELEYKRMAIDLHSKVYFTVESMVRPFFGLGVALNRAVLSYKTQSRNGVYSYQGQQMGQEEYRSSYVTGEASIGSEILFNDTFGLSLAVSYAQGFDYGFEQEFQSYQYNPDQERLNNHGDKIQRASILSAQVGLVLQF